MAKHDIDMPSLNRSAIRRQKVTRKLSAAASSDADQRGLYTGLIHLHVLHHAAKEADYGFAMIEELRCHGYELSAGTLYPILHGLAIALLELVALFASSGPAWRASRIEPMAALRDE
jgi:Transcriptional regulator PadR-like family